MRRSAAMFVLIAAALSAPVQRSVALPNGCIQGQQPVDQGQLSIFVCPSGSGQRSLNGHTDTWSYTKIYVGVRDRNLDVQTSDSAESYGSSSPTRNTAEWFIHDEVSGRPTLPGWPTNPFGHDYSFYSVGGQVGQAQTQLEPSGSSTHKTYADAGVDVAPRDPSGSMDDTGVALDLEQNDATGSCQDAVDIDTWVKGSFQHTSTPLGACPAEIPYLPLTTP
jgi:hypothetical protein